MTLTYRYIHNTVVFTENCPGVVYFPINKADNYTVGMCPDDSQKQP